VNLFRRAAAVVTVAAALTLTAGPAVAHTGGYSLGTSWRCYSGCAFYSGYVSRDLDSRACWHEHRTSYTKLIGSGPWYVSKQSVSYVC
jgi:hypothetical protein